MKLIVFRVLFASLLSGLIFAASAQNSDETVLLNIAGTDITVGEFMAIYKKNNVQDKTIDQKSLDEYLNLFINFKLKVREAEDLGLDTLASFTTELAGYREQLAKPYFTDQKTIDSLVKEAYQRSLQDIRASHIFVRIAPDATPDDTLAAWQLMSDLKKRIRKGESFEALAVEFSQDPSARDREATGQHPFIKGNKGDLGYFTVFDMVYPFESAAYQTPVGSLSDPVRSQFGYHLLKVTEKHPAMGKVTVAHLYKSIPKGASAEDSLLSYQKIDSAWMLLNGGADWDSLVKAISDDKGSSARGGVLPEFGVNRMVPEFIEAIYTLQDSGSYSKPVLTTYGWHIIRLVTRKPAASFDDSREEIKQRVIKDSRSKLGRDVVIARIIDTYGLKQYIQAKEAFYTVVTDSIFLGAWNISQANGMDAPLFIIGNEGISQQDFAKYLVAKQKKQDKQNIETYVNAQYKEFLYESLLKYENARLEEKYPEFKSLMQEYRDGILLFDLTDKKVWSKAVKDTTGLQAFYDKHKSSYLWGPRVDASIYISRDEEIAKRVKNFITTGLSDEDIVKEINGEDQGLLVINSGKYSKSENDMIRKVKWEKGLSEPFTTSQGIVMVNIREVLEPQPKELNEARGLITADYQNYLEEEWIRELKSKYPVEVKKEVFAKIN